MSIYSNSPTVLRVTVFTMIYVSFVDNGVVSYYFGEYTVTVVVIQSFVIQLSGARSVTPICMC